MHSSGYICVMFCSCIADVETSCGCVLSNLFGLDACAILCHSIRPGRCTTNSLFSVKVLCTETHLFFWHKSKTVYGRKIAETRHLHSSPESPPRSSPSSSSSCTTCDMSTLASASACLIAFLISSSCGVRPSISTGRVFDLFLILYTKLGHKHIQGWECVCQASEPDRGLTAGLPQLPVETSR